MNLPVCLVSVKSFKHWLWVRYMRIRYPKRPPDPRFPPTSLLIRDDGLVQWPSHTASPFETTETEADYEKYPTMLTGRKHVIKSPSA
jgi:hypothetical protein